MFFRAQDAELTPRVAAQRNGLAGMARGMFADNAEKERVRDASDIVRIVGEHVALKAKGREYVGLCPFHDDHRPSMNVVPGKQIFHCFVCGSGGDVFGFVQKYHKMEFREALEYLAERAGIELSRGRPEVAAGDGEGRGVARSDLIRANASAADFFRAILRHGEHGAAGREAIARRGISPEMVERFGLGLAPDRWDGLVLTARKMGMDAGVFVEAGLLKRRDDGPGGGGGFFDMFRNRLIFPIHDQIGRPIAFGARRLREEDEPKYLNSPETRVFEKSGTLYGLAHAARAIQTERVAIITEGYTDTIACHQAGFANVVATLGTALTPRHAQVLRRMCDTVVLLFDGDAAGQKAADRAVEVFIREDIGVRIATLAGVTDAKDPDELLKREGGAAVLRRAIDAGADLLLYRYERVRASLGSASPERLYRIVEDEIARLVELGLNDLHPVRRHFIIRRLAQIAGVREETIERSIPRGRAGRVPAERPPPGPLRPRREQLLGCLLCDGAVWHGMDESEGALVTPGRFEDANVRRVAEAIAEVAADGQRPGLDAVLARLDDAPEAKAAAVGLHQRVLAVTDEGRRVRALWDECVLYERMDDAKGRAAPAAGEGVEGLAGRLRELRGRAVLGDRRVLPIPVRRV